jgi:3-hydroxyacyl-CoA dehydrogenase
MRWGYAWALGPFEMWDALSVERTVERMQTDAMPIATWVMSMLENGGPSFYRFDGDNLVCYDPPSGQYHPVPASAAEGGTAR